MAERCLSQDVHDSTLLSAVTPDQSVIVITLQTLQQIAEQCMYASWGRSVGQLGRFHGIHGLQQGFIFMHHRLLQITACHALCKLSTITVLMAFL